MVPVDSTLIFGYKLVKDDGLTDNVNKEDCNIDNNRWMLSIDEVKLHFVKK